MQGDSSTCVPFFRWTLNRVSHLPPLVDVKDLTLSFMKSGASYHRIPEQITNSYPDYYWESKGKPPSVNLAVRLWWIGAPEGVVAARVVKKAL